MGPGRVTATVNTRFSITALNVLTSIVAFAGERMKRPHDWGSQVNPRQGLLNVTVTREVLLRRGLVAVMFAVGGSSTVGGGMGWVGGLEMNDDRRFFYSDLGKRLTCDPLPHGGHALPIRSASDNGQ